MSIQSSPETMSNNNVQRTPDEISEAAFRKQFPSAMGRPLVRSAILNVDGPQAAVDGAQRQYALRLVSDETGKRPQSVVETFAVEDQLATIKEIDSRSLPPASASK